MDVIDWLLDADPAIRWQALRDLTDADSATLATERARVAHSGLAAEILACQDPAGPWHKAGEQDWVATLYMAMLLRTTGADPADPVVDAAIANLAGGFRWHEQLGGKPFFDGETEPCINGGALALGGYFRRPSAGLAERLLGEQLGDGGWNCEAPNSTRSSYHSTICVLEGLLEYEGATGSTAGSAEARRRGEAYLLDRGMFRRRSTGELAAPELVELAFPPRCYYDVLRGLDYLRAAGVAPDDRVADAIKLIEDKRQPDGRWLLDAGHNEAIDVSLGEAVGQPSRWITLRALRVLRWYASSPRVAAGARS